jgi:sugar lactone lactonase YvrE
LPVISTDNPNISFRIICGISFVFLLGFGFCYYLLKYSSGSQNTTNVPALGTNANDCSIDTTWTNNSRGSGAIGFGGIAVDPIHNFLYAAGKTGNVNILKFDLQTGAYISALGTPGEFGGCFTLSLDQTYNFLYMGDRVHDAVYKVNVNDGSIASTVVSGFIGGINGVFVDINNDVYVTSDSTNQVYRYTPFGSFYTGGILSLPDPPSIGKPSGIYKSGNTLVITDATNNQVVAYEQSGSSFISPTIWASSGSSVSQVADPLEIAGDSSGNFYVSCFGDNQFMVFNPTGKFLYGCNNPEFASPVGIAVDLKGNVYLGAYFDNLIKKVNRSSCVTLSTSAPKNIPSYAIFFKKIPSYEFEFKWGGEGSNPGQFREPIDAIVDGSGNLYVTDWYNCRIQKFDPTGAFILQFGSCGKQSGQFDIPLSLGLDGQGSVYVLEAGNARVQTFDVFGIPRLQWGEPGKGNGQLNRPHSLAVYDNYVYITDQWNNRVEKFDLKGNYILQWGDLGSDKGQFNNPVGITTDLDGNVWVTDHMNHRIEKFDSEGNFLLQFGKEGHGPGEFEHPQGLRFDSHGDLFVADDGNNRIQVFGPDLSYLTQWGSFGTRDGQFNRPTGIAIDGKDNVYVVDSQNHRIQKFRRLGSSIPFLKL